MAESHHQRMRTRAMLTFGSTAAAALGVAVVAVALQAGGAMAATPEDGGIGIVGGKVVAGEWSLITFLPVEVVPCTHTHTHTHTHTQRERERERERLAQDPLTDVYSSR